MITLALTGDVMLGRGVNKELRTMPPEEVWGDALPLLKSAGHQSTYRSVLQP